MSRPMNEPIGMVNRERAGRGPVTPGAVAAAFAAADSGPPPAASSVWHLRRPDVGQ